MLTTAATIFVPCDKCHGVGYIDHYANIANGICFACAGSKGRTTTEIAEAKRAAARTKRQAATAAKREAKLVAYQAAGDDRWAAFAADYPAEAGALLEMQAAEVVRMGIAGVAAYIVNYVRCGTVTPEDAAGRLYRDAVAA